jgi:hypothetical protein
MCYNFVLIRGATLSTNPLVLESSALIAVCNQKMVLPVQSHSTGVQPHDGAMTKAHDGNMVVF